MVDGEIKFHIKIITLHCSWRENTFVIFYISWRHSDNKDFLWDQWEGWCERRGLTISLISGLEMRDERHQNLAKPCPVPVQAPLPSLAVNLKKGSFKFRHLKGFIILKLSTLIGSVRISPDVSSYGLWITDERASAKNWSSWTGESDRRKGQVLILEPSGHIHDRFSPELFKICINSKYLYLASGNESNV